MAQKILLDTDIGSDIDDAVCLAYLLAQPECELLGITTVTGQPETRAMLCSALCRAAGKEVPIYPGCADPLIVAQRQPEVPQAKALQKWPHATQFPRGEAIEFLRRTIRANPGEIVLLTIGPLTNAGLLFTVDPEVCGMLKGLVMMCGQFGLSPDASWHPVEWNAGGDPHATARVYRGVVRQHRSIGLDVTMQVRMEAPEVRERFQAPLLRPVLDFHQHWFEGQGTIVFHDPLAATTIFDPKICQFARGMVAVELEKADALGLTHWSAAVGSGEQGTAPHEVATHMDSARFFEHYFSVF